jgi:hypothetical protein
MMLVRVCRSLTPNVACYDVCGCSSEGKLDRRSVQALTDGQCCFKCQVDGNLPAAAGAHSATVWKVAVIPVPSESDVRIEKTRACPSNTEHGFKLSCDNSMYRCLILM